MKTTETQKDGRSIVYRPTMSSPKELEAWTKHRAALFRVRRLPREERPRPAWKRKRILYVRVANAAILYVGRWEISWRMPRLLASLWGAAWDAGWRRGFSSGWIEAHKAVGNKPADPPEGRVERLGPGSFEEMFEHLTGAGKDG